MSRSCLDFISPSEDILPELSEQSSMESLPSKKFVVHYSTIVNGSYAFLGTSDGFRVYQIGENFKQIFEYECNSGIHLVHGTKFGNEDWIFGFIDTVPSFRVQLMTKSGVNLGDVGLDDVVMNIQFSENFLIVGTKRKVFIFELFENFPINESSEGLKLSKTEIFSLNILDSKNIISRKFGCDTYVMFEFLAGKIMIRSLQREETLSLFEVFEKNTIERFSLSQSGRSVAISSDSELFIYGIKNGGLLSISKEFEEKHPIKKHDNNSNKKKYEIEETEEEEEKKSPKVDLFSKFILKRRGNGRILDMIFFNEEDKYLLVSYSTGKIDVFELSKSRSRSTSWLSFGGSGNTKIQHILSFDILESDYCTTIILNNNNKKSTRFASTSYSGNLYLFDINVSSEDDGSSLLTHELVSYRNNFHYSIISYPLIEISLLDFQTKKISSPAISDTDPYYISFQTPIGNFVRTLIIKNNNNNKKKKKNKTNKNKKINTFLPKEYFYLYYPSSLEAMDELNLVLKKEDYLRISVYKTSKKFADINPLCYEKSALQNDYFIYDLRKKGEKIEYMYERQDDLTFLKFKIKLINIGVKRVEEITLISPLWIIFHKDPGDGDGRFFQGIMRLVFSFLEGKEVVMLISKLSRYIYSSIKCLSGIHISSVITKKEEMVDNNNNYRNKCSVWGNVLSFDVFRRYRVSSVFIEHLRFSRTDTIIFNSVHNNIEEEEEEDNNNNNNNHFRYVKKLKIQHIHLTSEGRTVDITEAFDLLLDTFPGVEELCVGRLFGVISSLERRKKIVEYLSSGKKKNNEEKKKSPSLNILKISNVELCWGSPYISYFKDLISKKNIKQFSIGIDDEVFEKTNGRPGSIFFSQQEEEKKKKEIFVSRRRRKKEKNNDNNNSRNFSDFFFDMEMMMKKPVVPESKRKKKESIDSDSDILRETWYDPLRGIFWNMELDLTKNNMKVSSVDKIFEDCNVFVDIINGFNSKKLGGGIRVSSNMNFEYYTRLDFPINKKNRLRLRIRIDDIRM